MRFHSIHQCLIEKAHVQLLTSTVTSKYCPLPPPLLVVLDSVLHLVLVFLFPFEYLNQNLAAQS